MMLNKLLEKQICKHLGGEDAIPDVFRPLLKVISDAYDYYENDRKLLERSSDLSSKEMLHLNGQLRREADEVRRTHAELNRILNNINEAFFSLDVILKRYIFISPACEKIYGYKAEEFTAHPMLWKEVIHPDDTALIDAHDARIYQGERLTYEYRIIHRDASIRWVEAKVIPTLDEGRLIRIDAVVHDITARKNTQIELEKANRELSMLFNNLDDVMYSVDMTTYQLTQMSPSCEIVYGYTPGEFFADGDLWNRVIHPDDKYILQEHFATIQRGDKLRNSYRIIHKDGSIRWIENSVIPTIDHSGRVIRLDGITRDVTEKKAVQQNLEETSRKLNDLFHTIDEVIYSIDTTTGNITHMSPACEKLYGYPPATFYTHPELWYQCTHPEDADRVAGYTSQLMTGRQITDQCRVINRNKELRWVEYKIVPILDNEGTLIRIDGVARDITEKKLSEQLLQKSEANLRAVFENTDTGYLLLDTELRIVSYNHQVQRFALRNLSSQFRESSYVLDYFPDHRKLGLKTMLDMALTGENISYEIAYDDRDSVPTWFFIRIRCVRGGDNAIMGLTISITDITLRKNNEEYIKALNESLEAKVRERTAELEAFSYSVSHDLRAPLRVIHGYAQMLVDDCQQIFTAEDKENINVIMSTADQMGRLIDDLLNFSRLGLAAFEKTQVDMRAMAQAVVDEFRHGGTSMPAITIHPLPYAECDPRLTHQVWANLISNAIKYSAKSSSPAVEIGARDIDGQLTYYVKDNGAGFDMKYAGKLFGVFQRLHEVKDYEGTGVGLALSHRIVTRQGGRIWAEAKVNEGATFYFTLPSGMAVG